MPHERNSELAAAVTDILPHIRKLVREHIPKFARQDVAQDAVVHLLEKCADAAPAHATLTTYLVSAARNFVIDRRRQINRQLRNRPEGGLDLDRKAPDTSADRHVEQLAACVTEAPEAHFCAFKARLLRAVMDHPGASGAEIAEQLGLSVNTIWPALSRIRGEITNMIRTRSA